MKNTIGGKVWQSCLPIQVLAPYIYNSYSRKKNAITVKLFLRKSHLKVAGWLKSRHTLISWLCLREVKAFGVHLWVVSPHLT